jgi:hypothetical protein
MEMEPGEPTKPNQPNQSSKDKHMLSTEQDTSDPPSPPDTGALAFHFLVFSIISLPMCVGSSLGLRRLQGDKG